MKIYAPVKDFNGLRNNVRFVNGVGETDDPRLIEWFKTHGYTVENTQESTQELRNETSNLVTELQNDEIEVVTDEVEPTENKPRELEDMTPNELRELAKTSGKGHLIKNTHNKDKLIEILRG